MGHKKKQKKKYGTPKVIWDAVRLEEEREIKRDYGLRVKREIWKMSAILRRARKHAIELIPKNDKQAEKEKKELIDRLVKLGLINPGAKMEDILGLNLKSILDRRLQTVVYKLGLARTPKQARQMIVHGHIGVDGCCVDVPSYLVKRDEESKINFLGTSQFMDSEHPERIVKVKAAKAVPVKVKEQPKVEAKKEMPKKEVEEKQE